jgi:hypothetical protein
MKRWIKMKEIFNISFQPFQLNARGSGYDDNHRYALTLVKDLLQKFFDSPWRRAHSKDFQKISF